MKNKSLWTIRDIFNALVNTGNIDKAIFYTTKIVNDHDREIALKNISGQFYACLKLS